MCQIIAALRVIPTKKEVWFMTVKPILEVGKFRAIKGATRWRNSEGERENVSIAIRRRLPKVYPSPRTLPSTAGPRIWINSEDPDKLSR